MYSTDYLDWYVVLCEHTRIEVSDGRRTYDDNEQLFMITSLTEQCQRSKGKKLAQG